MANIGGPCWRKNGVPYLELPFRVVLSNGFTRTDPSQYSLEPDVMNDIGFESSTLTQNDLDILFPPPHTPPVPELPKTWLELGYTTPEGWKLGWAADDSRSRVMGTRCSGRSPKSMVGAATWGKALVGTPVGMTPDVEDTVVDSAAEPDAPACTAASTSPLVTRPSLPVPGTKPEDRLLSAISLEAAGMATPA